MTGPNLSNVQRQNVSQYLETHLGGAKKQFCTACNKDPLLINVFLYGGYTVFEGLQNKEFITKIVSFESWGYLHHI
jgi:hypothetical protein